jgi:uncharacterized protein involved in type VI secretion and phage assembly
VPATRYGTRPVVRLGGQRLPGALEPLLISLRVETDVTAPGTCLLTFADPAGTVLDELGVEYQQSIEVTASAVEEQDERVVFAGEVYGLDLEADERGSFAHVLAYDVGFRLRQRRGTRSFNDVTDGDVVRQLADDAGVATGTIDSGDIVHPYLAQLNETHWDFLVRRARACDRTLTVRDGKLCFTRSALAGDGPSPGDHASTDPLQLVAGRNLTYVRLRATASQQVAEVEVRGWDPMAKAELVATAPASSRSAQFGAEPGDVGRRCGAAVQVVTAPGLRTQAECEQLAASVGEMVAATFGYLEGVAIGDPRLQAGVAVSVGRAGRFDGRYVLTSARHDFDGQGYRTSVVVSGEHDRSLHGLTTGERAVSYPGVYPAVVTNVSDPDGQGRVRLRLPWLAADFETDWARVVQIGAGPDRGVLWFPEVDDEVLVAFVGGDPTQPAVIGGLYNGSDTPPFDGFGDLDDGRVDVRGFRTRAGHALVFRDKGGEERVELRSADDSLVVTLDQAASKIVVESGGDVEVNAGGAVSLHASGDMSLHADGSATISAKSGLKLESTGQVEITGALIKLN